MITLLSGNALPCAELNSIPIIVNTIKYVVLWELCVLGSLVGAVSISGCQFWCDVIRSISSFERLIFSMFLCCAYEVYIQDI